MMQKRSFFDVVGMLLGILVMGAQQVIFAVPNTTEIHEVFDETELVLYGVVTAAETGDLPECAMYGAFDPYGPVTIQVKEVLQGSFAYSEAHVKLVGFIHEHFHLHYLVAPGDKIVIFASEVAGNLLTLAGKNRGLYQVNPERGAYFSLDYVRLKILLYSIPDKTQQCNAIFKQVQAGKIIVPTLYDLRNIRPCIEKHLDLVLEMLNSANREDISQALSVLSYRPWNFFPPEVTPRLIELTRNEDQGIAKQASMSLNGSSCPEAVEALVALSHHKEADLRCQACIDLGECNAEKAQKAVVERLADEEASVRAVAARSLSYWFGKGEVGEAIPKVIALLSDSDHDVRISAVKALGHAIVPEAPRALLSFLENEQDKKFLGAVLVSLKQNAKKECNRIIIAPYLDRVIAIIKEPTMGKSFRYDASLAQGAIGLLREFAAHGNKKAYGALARLAVNKELQFVSHEATEALVLYREQKR